LEWKEGSHIKENGKSPSGKKKGVGCSKGEDTQDQSEKKKCDGLRRKKMLRKEE